MVILLEIFDYWGSEIMNVYGHCLLGYCYGFVKDGTDNCQEGDKLNVPSDYFHNRILEDHVTPRVYIGGVAASKMIGNPC